jgi:hypothetical protein
VAEPVGEPMRENEREEEQRGAGLTIDLERLEAMAKDLYLHRFVAYVKKARGDHGRYLKLRPGDESAIRAAGDGSEEYLEEIIATEE